MRKTKKLLSVLIAAAMVVCMLTPLSVFADSNVAQVGDVGYATLSSAISAASSGATVTLIGDENVTSTVTLYKDLTLDLNGHTLTMNVTSGMTGAVYLNGHSLTIQDNSAGQTGLMDITSKSGNGAYGFYLSGSGSNLVIESGNIIVKNATATSFFDAKGIQAVTVGSGTTFTMTGGSLTASNVNYSGKAPYAVYVTGGTANITGGSVIVDDYDTYGWSDDHLVYKSSGTVNVTGGQFKSPKQLDYNGLISKLPSDYILAAADADGFRAVVKAAAKIGTTKYATLEAAVSAAQDGDTIVLLDDVTYGADHSVDIWQVKEFSLDLNGHTLTTNAGANAFWASAICYGDYTETSPARNVSISNGTVRSAYGTGIYASDAVTVTLSGLDVKQDSTKVQSTAEYSSAIRLTSGATVIVEDGSYEGKYSIAVSNSGGDVIVNDGTFVGGIFFSTGFSTGLTAADKTITINGGTFTDVEFVNTNKGTLTIYGGTFDQDPTDYVAEGYMAVNNGDGTWTVENAYVAQIGETKYATLAAAIAAANEMDNATVTLLKDYDMEANEPGYGWTTSYVAAGETTPRNNMIEISGTGLTLDLNGYTLSNLYNNTFKVTGQNVTVENGTMTIGTLYAGSYSTKKGVTLYPTPRLCSYVILANYAQNFTINDLSTTGGINISMSTTATVNGLNFSGASYYAICSQEGSDVTINGGTFDKATAGYANYLVWVEDETDSVMTINGGTFLKGSATFCDVADGLPIIYGGTFDFDPTNFGVADGYEAVNNGDGTWTVGEVKAGNLVEAAETTENYDATYTVKKQVIDSNDDVIFDGTSRTVNVKVVTEAAEIASDNTADEIIDSLKMDEVLSDVVANVADAGDTINVEIQVVRDEPEIVNNAITYEVHPEAVVYVNDALAGTVAISNDALKDNAVFTITLPVPNELAATGYVKVTHISEGYDDEVQVYAVQGDADNYFVQLEVTHFSEFEVATNDLPLFSGHSISLNGYVDLNFYLNLASDQVTTGTGTVVDFAWDKGDASYTVAPSDFVAGKGYKATVRVPAAEMSCAINATVTINGVEQSETNVYSVREYAMEIINDAGSSEALVNLVKAMLDYGTKAQYAFDVTDVVDANIDVTGYTMGAVTTGMIDAAIAAANGDASANNIQSVAEQFGGNFYSPSLIYLSGSTLRIYLTGDNFDVDVYGFDGVKESHFYYLDKTDIAAAQLDTLQTFTVGGVTFKYSALDFVKAIIGNYQEGTPAYNLAAATYWYNAAANAYFGQ